MVTDSSCGLGHWPLASTGCLLPGARAAQPAKRAPPPASFSWAPAPALCTLLITHPLVHTALQGWSVWGRASPLQGWCCCWCGASLPAILPCSARCWSAGRCSSCSSCRCVQRKGGVWLCKAWLDLGCGPVEGCLILAVCVPNRAALVNTMTCVTEVANQMRARK